MPCLQRCNPAKKIDIFYFYRIFCDSFVEMEMVHFDVFVSSEDCSVQCFLQNAAVVSDLAGV